jgi:CRP-like cAMP-binding protein
MDSRDKWRNASRERVKAAEARLLRLREVIERRARLGYDTSEGWRLFRLSATTLASMRQTETLLEALHQAGERRSWAAQAAELVTTGAERVAFAAGETIKLPEPEASNCHLIETGIASLCFGDAGGVEVGMVGPGGIIGLSALLSAQLMPVTAVATTRCYAIPIPLSELASRIGSDVKGLRFLHATTVQQWAETMVLARCNAEHSVRERVARWILTGARHLQGVIGPISHDRMASLLGVRRASVTVALHEFESEGAIASRRNIIEVKDESSLERLSCDCHGYLFGRATGRLPAHLPGEHAIQMAN